jgi:hypothetical protein
LNQAFVKERNVDHPIIRRIVLLPVVLSAFAALACAQDTAAMVERMAAMERRIQALEAELAALKGGPAAAVPAPEAAAAPAAAPVAPAQEVPLGGAGGAAAKALNPNISVIGDFLGAAGYGASRSGPAFEMHETEVGFQEVVDPYARADFFLSFGHEGVALEEGYITFTALPAALQLRAGKMRAAFGKVNAMHNHVLPWTDRPLVTQNLVAGEDGINDAGFSLSRLLPAPKNIFLEATGQVYRGEAEGLFSAARRSDVSAVGHLRGYGDLSESTNLDLGISYARGHSPLTDAANQLYGIDATLRWKPLRRAIYHSFVARSEFIWARAHTGLAPPVAVTTPFGYYVSGDYQFARRWIVGGRFDRSGRLSGENLRDTGGSLLLTYWPSEFSQIRGQLRRTRYAENLTANELLFQFQFSVGAHGAHVF